MDIENLITNINQLHSPRDPSSPTEISKIESKLKVRFDSTVHEVYLSMNGAILHMGKYSTINVREFGDFSSLGELLIEMEAEPTWTGDAFVVFADDCDGDYFCFGFSDSRTEITGIFQVDHELIDEYPEKVSDTFVDFLKTRLALVS
jgi:SMI1-KNR4 cell-wall